MSKSHFIIKRIAIPILILILLGGLFAIPVSAATITVEAPNGETIKVEDSDGNGEISRNEINAYAKEELGRIKYGIYWFTHWKFLGNTWIVSFCDGLFDSSLYIQDEAYVVVEGISSAIMVIGKMFCVLYFLLSLIDSATQDSFTLESFIKSFAKLVIIYIVFDPHTMQAISNFGAGLEDLLLDSVIQGTTNSHYGELAEYILLMEDESWLKCLGYLFENSVFSLTMLVSIIVVLCVSFGRAVELVVYQALLPLGMGSIYNGGLNSSGFRYVKKWIALYIQGAIMLIVMILGHMIGTAWHSIPILYGASGLYDVVMALATAMIIARSKSIANDVMGV